MLPFTDSVRSGAATRRRIMSVDASVSIPTERTVTEASGQVYVIAVGNEDYFDGDIIRVKYPVLPVDVVYAIRSIGQILLGSGGETGVYAAPSYLRRVFFDDDSENAGGFSVYLSSYYSVTAGEIFHGADGRYYRSKENSRVEEIGFGVVEAVEVVDPITTVTVQHKSGTVLNPVTDDYVAATPITNVSVFVEQIKLDYQHEALGFVELKESDRAISFLKSIVASIGVGDQVGDYLVKSVSDETTFWTVHGRKV